MNRPVVYARVSPEVKEAAQATAQYKGISLSRYVEEALRQHVRVDEMIRNGEVPDLTRLMDAFLRGFRGEMKDDN